MKFFLYVVNVKKGYHHPLVVVMMVGYQRALVLAEIAVRLDCPAVAVGMIEREVAVGMIEREVLSWNPGSFRRHRHRHHGCHHVEAFACVHRLLVVYFVFVQSVCRPIDQVSVDLQLGLPNPY
jgi:hypothetical protein